MTFVGSPRSPAGCLFTSLPAFFVPARVNEDALGYQMLPKVLADIIDAPQTPWVTTSPDNQWLLFLELPGLPSIEEVAQPELRLAHLRMNSRDNGHSRQNNAAGPARVFSLTGFACRVGRDRARWTEADPDGENGVR